MIWRYRVTGIVRTLETGEPLAGLVVRGYDKDLIFDDHLGDTLTDQAGCFELEFTDEAFRSVFDQNPDIYLRILEPETGREIHSTLASVRRNAGEEEHFELCIPQERLG